MSVSVDIHARLSDRFTLSVAFEADDRVTILFGPSGCGKTSVLRAIAGLLRPTAGRIAIGGKTFFDAGQVDVPVRHRRVGYVFQHLALFPHLSIEDNIGYGLTRLSAAERRDRVHTIADSFGIGSLLGRRPGQTSGGERQRAALARALVIEPAALLLDEPLSALDHAIQSRIMDDLRRWHARHRIPILYVTHSHREAYSLGDHVIALDHGRVAASGSPHDVLDHPVRETLAHLAGFENVFDATVLERRERAGTMHCRLGASATELEVPLTGASAGSPLRVGIRAGDILVATQPPQGISARNILPGRIAGLRREGSTVIAGIEAGVPFVVHLTHGAADALGLAVGTTVWLIVKMYSCRVLTE